MVADVVLPTKEDGREVLVNGEQTRVAHPLAVAENCATQTELDFLQRFFEASDFAAGHCRLFSDDGEPLGRYADHVDRIDAQSYLRYEISAYQWVRRFGLGREWSTIAEMFCRMMAGKTETGAIDWGSFLTNSDDERISYGGAMVSFRMLGLRLKDCYRDFARFYKTLQQESEKGREFTPREALREVERDVMYSEWINDFKRNRGLSPG